MTTKTDVEIKEALLDNLTSIMTTGSLWDDEPFTVYQDFDAESMTGEPVQPYVFVATRNTRQPIRWFPFLGVDIEIDAMEFQLGSTGCLARITISVIDQFEGTASDIAGVIKRNFTTFTSGGDVFRQQYVDGKLWHEKAIAPPEPEFREGTLNQWIAIMSAFAIL